MQPEPGFRCPICGTTIFERVAVPRAGGTLYLTEGEFCRAVAMHNAPKAFAEANAVIAKASALSAALAKHKVTLAAPAPVARASTSSACRRGGRGSTMGSVIGREDIRVGRTSSGAQG